MKEAAQLEIQTLEDKKADLLMLLQKSQSELQELKHKQAIELNIQPIVTTAQPDLAAAVQGLVALLSKIPALHRRSKMPYHW